MNNLFYFLHWKVCRALAAPATRHIKTGMRARVVRDLFYCIHWKAPDPATHFCGPARHRANAPAQVLRFTTAAKMKNYASYVRLVAEASGFLWTLTKYSAAARKFTVRPPSGCYITASILVGNGY